MIPGKIYLHREFPEHLYLNNLNKLPLHRLKAYYKKHRHYLGKIKDKDYKYQENDLMYNSEFGTSPESQFKEYFASIKKMIEEKSIE